MSDGLVTRIGKWIDNKWKNKATEESVDQLKFDLTQAIRINGELTDKRLDDLEALIAKIELGELKTRLEKIELYCGMTRKVDPTKPAVAKSAFSM